MLENVQIAASSKARSANASDPYTAYSNRTPISIAPVGVNLGAILQAANSGSSENGGEGVVAQNRFLAGMTDLQAVLNNSSVPSTSKMKYIAISACIIAGIFILKKRKK